MGAELASGGVHFRVFAPKRKHVEVVIESSGAPARTLQLTRSDDGHFAGLCDGVGAGSLYRLRLDGDAKLLPDPASRFQPDGPHGPSQVVDPSSFTWTDEAWPGVKLRGQVVYEMHNRWTAWAIGS